MAEFDYAVFAGNIGAIYEMRRVGKDQNAVVDFTVATTRRKRVDGEWTDAPPRWRRVTVWNRLAENFVESFEKGDRVMVVGNVEMQDEWTDKDGNVREPREQIIAVDVGHSVQRWPAKSERDPSKNRSYDNGGGGNSQRNSAPNKTSNDPLDDAEGDLLSF